MHFRYLFLLPSLSLSSFLDLFTLVRSFLSFSIMVSLIPSCFCFLIIPFLLSLSLSSCLLASLFIYFLLSFSFCQLLLFFLTVSLSVIYFLICPSFSPLFIFLLILPSSLFLSIFDCLSASYSLSSIIYANQIQPFIHSHNLTLMPFCPSCTEPTHSTAV